MCSQYICHRTNTIIECPHVFFPLSLCYKHSQEPPPMMFPSHFLSSISGLFFHSCPLLHSFSKNILRRISRVGVFSVSDIFCRRVLPILNDDDKGETGYELFVEDSKKVRFEKKDDDCDNQEASIDNTETVFAQKGEREKK